MQAMQKLVDENEKQWMEDYFTFLRFPSVSSEKEYQPSILACAKWLEDFLKKLGFSTEYWESSGHPVLFASNLNAGPHQPTLLIYHHYDVQPVDPLNEWHSPPFEPTLKNGNVYARGAQDNKGQCFYTLQALKLLFETTGKLPINVKLCIEGEEETGSAGLSELLAKGTYNSKLKADYLAVIDSGIKAPDTPSITLGIRGIVTMDVKVQGAKHDLHSGSYGGVAPNPIHALTSMLSQLRDQKGRVTIPGFYDDITPCSKEDKELLDLHFDHDAFYELTHTQATGGETSIPEWERAWMQPTLEVNGIAGGYAGDGFKTVIPAKAFAKVSCRLVAHQDPVVMGEKVKKHILSLAPKGVKVTVEIHPGAGHAAQVSPQAHIVKVFSQAYSEVFQKPCKFIMMGGSIPITAALAESCGGELVLVGLGLSTDQIHAPNEHFSIDRIKMGILIVSRVLELLAN